MQCSPAELGVLSSGVYHPHCLCSSLVLTCKVHGITRRIQARLNDFHLLLATNCQRNPDGTYTRASEELMDNVSAFSRLFHALFWASCARRFAVLRTTKGLERMAMRGILTSRQLRVLESLDVPSNQKHNACLEWLMIRTYVAIDDGTLRKSDALEQRLLDQLCQLRGTYASVSVFRAFVLL